jgi:hypothetical protein
MGIEFAGRVGGGTLRMFGGDRVAVRDPDGVEATVKVVGVRESPGPFTLDARRLRAGSYLLVRFVKPRSAKASAPGSRAKRSTRSSKARK